MKKVLNIVIFLLIISILFVGYLVYKNVYIGSFSVVNSDISIYVGEEANIEVTYTGKKKITYTYTVSENKLIKLEDNKITGLAKGTIDVTVKANEINQEQVVHVTINNIDVTSVKFTKKKYDLYPNDHTKLSYQILPSNATIKSVYFTTSKDGVVEINGNGDVTALTVGSVTVTIHADNNKTDTCEINIINPHIALTSIELKDSYTVEVGKKITLNPVLKPDNADDKTLIWSTSDKTIATVTNGVVTGIKAGTATIKVTNSIKEVTKEVKVKVVLPNQKIHFIKQTISSDAILLESGNHYAMVDTGYNECSKYTLNYLNKEKVTKLDFILITHAHNDHIGCGTAILNSNIKVDRIYIKTYLAGSKQYTTFLNTASKKNVPVTYIEKSFKDGSEIKLGNMSIKLYNTVQRMDKAPYKGGNENYNSVTQLVTVNNIKTFLTADSYSGSILQEAVNKIGKVDVMKVPHHGYRTCAMNSNRAKQLSPKHIIVTNSSAVSGKGFCLDDFDRSKPIYFVNNQNNGVVVDYTNNKVVISTN